jgi:hypothetical protein
MVVKRMLSVAIILILFATLIISCGDKKEAKAPEQTANSAIIATADVVDTNTSAIDTSEVVAIHLGIDGCVCIKYTDFEIKWDRKYAAIINQSALTDILIKADADSAFLCDCSNKDGKKYAHVIKSIKPFGKNEGLKLELTQEVYLDKYEIIPNLNDALQKRAGDVFGKYHYQLN